MLGRLILLSLRDLRRNLLYTIIVIGGLSLGMTTFLAIAQWTAWHYSSDRHFPDSERIFRLTIEEKEDDFERHTARILHGDLTQQIMQSEEIPEIEIISRLAPFRNAIVRKGDVVYYEDKTFACDPEFLQLFPPTVVQGDISTMLDAPFKLVLTNSMARKYFGEEDPVGQSLELLHQFSKVAVEYEITGIIEDYPDNTHFSVSLLTSFENPDTYKSTAWTYALIQQGVAKNKIEESLKNLILEYNDEEYVEGLFPRLTPLTDIHLKSQLAREIEMNARLRSVMIVSIAGLLVFILAWFNFTLLSVSQNQLNLKKLIFQWQLGAGKRTFYKQFFVDLMLVGIISLIIAALLSVLFGNVIFNTSGIHINENPLLLVLGFLGFLLLLLVSSLLTALYATSRLYNILRIRFLSNSGRTPRSLSGSNHFIRIVIILEFVITFMLLSNLFMMRDQVKYAMDQQIGSNDTTTIQIPDLPRPLIDKYTLFREEIAKHPVFSEMTAMMEEPGGMAMDAFEFKLEGLAVEDKLLFVFPVDKHFMKFYDLELIVGRDFPSDYDPGDTIDYYILNETAAKAISPGSYEDLLGRTFELESDMPELVFPGELIGVCRDFHLSSLERKIDPMVIFPKHTWLYCYSLRIQGDRQVAIETLEGIWKELFPLYPLRYYFTSELYETAYDTQLTVVRILIIFSILSLLIAGTGLFALSGFFMHQKMPAAAIRKINGASIRHILYPELKQYLLFSLISTLIAAPASYFMIKSWLSNFAYQLPIPFWIIPVSALLLITFSWIAVFYNAWKLARINPTELLRSE